MRLDTFLAHIAPHNCVGCGVEGRLLCDSCSAQLISPAGRCYRCHRLSPNGRTCASCRRPSKLYSVRSVFMYEGVAKTLVWRLKFGSARAASGEMARMMTYEYKLDASALIVPVPTATSRKRLRGYDQAQLLARELARLERLPYHNGLRRLGQHKQVGASRRQRLTQLEGAFRVSGKSLLKDAHIVLIDDVITTGATLEAAAATLKAAGAKRVEAIVFAQA